MRQCQCFKSIERKIILQRNLHVEMPTKQNIRVENKNSKQRQLGGRTSKIEPSEEIHVGRIKTEHSLRKASVADPVQERAGDRTQIIERVTANR